MIKRIPWKALGILAAGLILGFTVGTKFGHNITWLTTEKTLNTKTVNDAVNKPTTQNVTHNQVEIKKQKVKGDSIKFSFEPSTSQQAITLIGKDSCVTLQQIRDMSMRDIRKLRKAK